MNLGADIGIENAEGHTAWRVALNNDHEDIAMKIRRSWELKSRKGSVVSSAGALLRKVYTNSLL